MLASTAMKHAFIAFVVAEIAYIASVRILLQRFPGGFFELELWWSALRVVSICALVWLARRLPPLAPSTVYTFSPRWLLATGMFAAPILTGDMGELGPTRHLFAATSVLVAIREELAYRAIFQRILTCNFGIWPGLVVSNLAFVAYHIGVGPPNLHFFLQVFLCGCILGLVYHLSGRIALVITLHAAYDAIDAYAPYLTPRLPDFVCNIVLTTTLIALLFATKPQLKKAPAP